ncbi:MAG: hypothetical protein DYG94_04590 [Leptolyngbya sp. PLA3]|nr:MAG: hypothetical protein EDM82_07305 [Cyanobacteria bacterium CYA]MCE7968009.1 hypothetical protein [Leptolyngbya sp. PL-A3]
MKRMMQAGGIGAGVAGLMLALGTGAVRPKADHRLEAGPADPVLRELGLIKGGLFCEGSRLPSDRASSMEQMLDQQGEILARLSARLSTLDHARLEAIERRLASFERTLDNLDTSEIDDLEREIGSMRRTLDAVARDVSNLPRVDLSGIHRTLEDIRRQVSQAGGSGGSGERVLGQVQSTLRSIESQLRSIERKLP